MNSLVTNKDMEVFNSKILFEDLKNLPLEFYRNGEYFYGIPNNFETEVTIEEKDEKIKTIYSATDEKGLNIRYEITKYKDFPVAEYVAYFTNQSQEDGDIISQPCAFRTTVEGSNPIFTYGTGDTSDQRGFHYITQHLMYWVKLSPATGNSCCGASPFMKLDFDEMRLRIAVGWPGMWEAHIEPKTGGVRLGVIQKRSYIKLKPGETIRTPSLTVMGFCGDDNKGINLWRRWYFKHIMPKKGGKTLKGMLVSNRPVEGFEEFTGITEEQQKDAIDFNIKNGFKPDLWWIDAGWYECGESWTNTGTWKPNHERLPNGLACVGQKCKENNMDFLLWFEPERAKRDSEIWKEHPEWFPPTDKHLYNGMVYEDGILNLGDKDCVEWISQKITGLIKEYGVNVYRQDFNHDPYSLWTKDEPEERMGARENAYVQGYLKFWDNLLNQNPGLLIDSCAGGGRRNEMETIKRGVPLHYTDVGYGAHPLKQKQMRMMYEWIPYFRNETQDWRDKDGVYNPSDVMGERNPDVFTLINSLAPVIGIKPLWDKPGTEILKDYIKVWRRAAEIMVGGDFYPLCECTGSPNEFYAVQFEESSKRCGFIQVINNMGNINEECVLYPHFEKDRFYKFEESDNEASFEVYRNSFKVKMKKGDAAIWFYSF